MAMKASFFQRLFYGCFVATCLVVAAGCSGTSNQDNQAQAIYDRANKLRSQGKIVAALKEFYQLVEYSHTDVFQKAEASLLKEGISINDPLNSWTLKKMITVQNSLVKKGKQRHPDGDITVPYPVTDAWGRSIVIKYSTGEKYTFAVCSAGEDKKFGNDDDLMVFNRLESKQQRKNNQDRTSLDALSGQERRTIPGGTSSGHRARTTENVIRLQDLMTTN
jgi:hypothetical protein